MGRPSLNPEQSARIVSRLQELRRTKFAGSISDLARALGRSQPSVSNILSGSTRPSFETAERVARVAGVDVWSLLGEWGQRHEDKVLSSRPNLSRALEIVGGKITPRARRETLMAAAHLPDIAVSAWVTLLIEVSQT